MNAERTRFSIIVPVRNVEKTIERTIGSILSQNAHFEIILVDGASTDDTLKRISRFIDRIDRVISEPDDGLYDAINKGIRHAQGDVIGILNGDDYYEHPGVLSLYEQVFADRSVDIAFADLVYFTAERPERVQRYYSSAGFRPEKLRYGWMPPHPTVYLRREAYERIGMYKTDYRIAADYELLVRALLVHRLTYRRIDSVVVRMQLGGISTSGMRATYTLNREVIRACRDNGVQTGWLRVLSKYPRKLLELVRRS